MDQAVGREVKRLREERGWGQAKLAVEAEMSVSGVSMIENGKRNLSTATLGKLANALGVGVADLFPKASRPSPKQLLEEAGVVTRWLIMRDEDFRAAFRGETWPEAAQKLIDIAPELADEYCELVPLMCVDKQGDSGRAALAPEYVDAWRRATQRFIRTHGALEELGKDEAAPDELRERARMAREYLEKNDDWVSQLRAKTKEEESGKSYV